MQIIPCAVRSAHLWLKSAKVELTSDSFAQPKQHVQCLVFPRLQRQMSRNLLEDKDAENTKRSTKVAKQIWKNLWLEKNVEEPSDKRDFALILKSFYVDARKKDGSPYSLGSLKTLRFTLNGHFKAVQSFDFINDPEFSDASKVFAAKWAPEWFRVIWAIQWFRVMRPLGEFALELHFTQ